ncbi:MAG: amino acid ABC transporter permease [Erysipelotrichaceae bacterium]|nr:amino acid ABC transporter permease [Erysipelotrichaceae bacterium]
MELIRQAIKIFLNYFPYLMKGALNTTLIALTGTVIGLIIGLITGIIRSMPLSENKILRSVQKLVNWIINAYVEVFRGTPMMVQAMVIYWGYAYAHNGATLPLFLSGLIIVSINTGAYMAEIVRGGIISIDKGQFEGAYSIGMTHNQTMFKVIIPQVMRNILPGASNEFVNNIKDTSVLNVIGTTELFYFGSMIKMKTFRIFETYLVVSVIYFVLNFLITRTLRFFEHLLEGEENYSLAASPTETTGGETK